MSNIFLKNELNNIFDSATESNVSLPKWINVIDLANKTNNNTTSSAFGQQGGSFSATSSAFGQQGGAFSATSAFGQQGGNAEERDVNKLISMLTSDSSSSAGILSQTTTQSLEDQLRVILNQDGGAKKKKSKKQRGGDDSINKDVQVEDIKKFFMNLKSQGVAVDVKLNNQSMSDFFGLVQNTTTEMNDDSATSSVNIQSILGDNIQQGGAKKKSAKKSSKKASKKSSKKATKDIDGGTNPGFQAFLDLKKHIAEKLGISNGPKAAKVAGAVQKDMKEKFPGKDAVSIAEEGRKHFDANMNHYKQMIPK